MLKYIHLLEKLTTTKEKSSDTNHAKEKQKPATLKRKDPRVYKKKTTRINSAGVLTRLYSTGSGDEPVGSNRSDSNHRL